MSSTSSLLPSASASGPTFVPARSAKASLEPSSELDWAFICVTWVDVRAPNPAMNMTPSKPAMFTLEPFWSDVPAATAFIPRVIFTFLSIPSISLSSSLGCGLWEPGGGPGAARAVGRLLGQLHPAEGLFQDRHTVALHP